MIRHPGEPNCAQIDGIVRTDLGNAVLGHHPTRLRVPLTRPIELVPPHTKAVAFRHNLHRALAGRYHLAPDPITRNGSDPVDLLLGHLGTPLVQELERVTDHLIG